MLLIWEVSAEVKPHLQLLLQLCWDSTTVFVDCPVQI
jgi:hypothetical protein